VGTPMMRAGMVPPNKGRRYPAEVQALLDQLSRRSATGIRNRALVVLLYKSGLRVSGICNLTSANVNLDKHSVRVRLGKSAKTTTRGFHPSAPDALTWLVSFRDYPPVQRAGPDARYNALAGTRALASCHDR
jgi:site-specific recombinase XerC